MTVRLVVERGQVNLGGHMLWALTYNGHYRTRAVLPNW